MLLLVAAGLFLTGAVMLVDYVRQGRQTRALQEELQQQRAMAPAATDAPLPVTQRPQVQLTQVPQAAALAAVSTQAPVLPRPGPTFGAPVMDQLLSVYRKNTDLVGWLKSDAIYDIDFPIVQRDNWFYVDKDFYGRDNVAGTVFLDEDNKIMPQDNNLVLHGHNMKNGTMFGKLVRLLDPALMRSAPLFNFSTLYEEETYVPYAIALGSIDPASQDYFSFLEPNFQDEGRFYAYTSWLRERSELALPVDVLPGDRMLTLVTCHGDEDSERLIVALRALREGESREGWMAAFAKGVASR